MDSLFSFSFKSAPSVICDIRSGTLFNVNLVVRKDLPRVKQATLPRVRAALLAHAACTSLFCLTQTHDRHNRLQYFTVPYPLSLLLERIAMYLNQCRGWQGETEPSTNPASAATDVRCRCTIQYHPCPSVWAVLGSLGSRSVLT
ncbi:Uncharacterized protein HZ326_25418 [Fusarium oxysporum f. sp. albedinis]|nr:Uncharacterized protein HZ326_25418 [Fusarium oxysporum f. sp. albedinis]